MFEKFLAPKELIPSDPRFGCGPSLIPKSFVESLAKTSPHFLGTSHRQNNVKKVVAEIRQGLRDYFSLPKDYEILLGNGGATFFWDMIGLGLVDKASTHFSCGEFSSKWYQVHQNIPWIESKNNPVPFGRGINPVDQKGFDVTCCTLNETSTGVMISDWSGIEGSHSLVAVDATSGAGQIPCPMSQVDLYYFSPQKVFASEGGLFIAFLSPRAIERAMRIAERKDRYIPIIMDWRLALENSTKDQTYNTPALSTLFFLNEQIKKMNTRGEKKVCAEAKEKADWIYSWAEKKPYLQPFVEESEFRSLSVATINVDEAYNVDDLTKVLRQQKVVYDIDAYRKLGKNQFRISLFDNIQFEDLKKLTQLLSLAIESV